MSRSLSASTPRMVGAFGPLAKYKDGVFGQIQTMDHLIKLTNQEYSSLIASREALEQQRELSRQQQEERRRKLMAERYKALVAGTSTMGTRMRAYKKGKRK